MADNANRAPGAPSDAQDEQKMRRALGLHGGGGTQTPQQRPEQARARHRFVQDGGVPVTVVNHRTDDSAAVRERLAEVQALLETERTQHAATRRLLSEQQAAGQALQTRLAHADLAHAEALVQERQARLAAQESLAEALGNGGRKPKVARVAPGREAASEPVRKPVPAVVAAPVLVSDAPPVVKRGRGRPRINPPKEPKPVRWWTPSFRNKTR